VIPPLIVVEGPDEALDAAIAAVRASGWTIRDGFRALNGERSRTVRCATIASSSDAADALLAALGGAGLVVAGRAPREVLDRLLDDLRHIGPVEHRVGPPTAAGPAVSEEARLLMARLAAGMSLGEAAFELGLSRRTADRRLAEARRALGSERTAEAVMKAKRFGWLG